jgi:hypothetical protein
MSQPATGLLQYAINTTNAIEECKRRFPKLPNHHTTIESNVHIQNLINSSIASIMGYFESYEKYLFAGIFERTVYFSNFNEKLFFNIFKNNCQQVEVRLDEFLAYRNVSASIGLILADSLTGWHEPQKVNSYFKGFGLVVNAFSNEDVNDLETLWQIRHSIVHTAGTITMPDSQKNRALANFGGKNIVLKNKFIYDLSRRLHSMVYHVNERLKEKVDTALSVNLSAPEKMSLLNFLTVRSHNPQWFV